MDDRRALGAANDHLEALPPAAADRDGEIALYDLRSGKETRDLSAPKRQPALPQRPVRMTFSPNGRHLFAAAGLTVKFPRESIPNIHPDAAFWLGYVAGGVVGGVTAAAVNDAVPDVWRNLRESRIGALMMKMCRQTAMRVWETAGGGMVANFWNVFEQHLTGLADAIVDLVSTGSTLAANNLVEVERILDISSRLVVNQAALKLKREAIRRLIDAFDRAVVRA